MSAFRQILGAFRILRRRTAAVGHPGLGMWADAGEQAAARAGAVVRDGAHRAETRARLIQQQIAAIVSDGKVTPAEVAELRRIMGVADRVAEECHDLGEVAS